jgi:hypothetical protein
MLSSLHAAAVNMGDVPTWIGGVSAALGLIAASIAAVFVKRQFDVLKDQLGVMKEQAAADREEVARQRADLAEAEQLRARAQAEQIDVTPGRHYAELQGINPETFLTLTVHNGSNRPIRGLKVKANPQGGDDPTHDLDLHLGRLEDESYQQPMPQIGDPTLNFVQDKSLRSPLALLRRDEDVSFLLALAADRWPIAKYWVQFGDDAGLVWELDSDMHLRRIEERWKH